MVTIKELPNVKQYLLQWCNELGRIPTQKEVGENPYLPTYSAIAYMFKKHEDKTYVNYCEENGHKKKKPSKSNFNEISWEELKKRYLHETSKAGRPLTTIELNSKNELSNILPSVHYLIKRCPDNTVKTYEDLKRHLGIKTRYNIDKDLAIKLILQKAEKVGRNLVYSDFENIDSNAELGIGTIINIWGSFTNMLSDLGFNKNKLIKTINEVLGDIDNICDMIISENRQIVTYDDFDSKEWSLDARHIDQKLRKELGTTLREHLLSKGFTLPNAGSGMNYIFEDGEKVKSQYEYDVSNYLRINGITYLRDIKYSNFIENYNGKKDCDYIITRNGIKYYIEIAGILNRNNISETDKVKTNYKRHLNEKIKMLQSANLNYKIIYPSDFKEKSLDEIFSFLFTTVN